MLPDWPCLFFMCTGFFTFKSIRMSHVMEKIVGLLKQYIFWTAVYIPFAYINYRKMDATFLDKMIIFIRKAVFVGSYSHLWYLPACALGILLTALLINIIQSEKIQMFIVAVVYFVGVCGQFAVTNLNGGQNAIIRMYFDVFETTRNGIFFGFPFVYLGSNVEKNEYDNRKYLMGFKCSLVFGIVELLCLRKYRMIFCNSMLDMYLFLFPAMYFMFSYLVHGCGCIKFSDSTWKLRKVANLIFYIHFIVIDVYCFLCARIMEHYPVFAHTLIQYMFITLISIASASILVHFVYRFKLKIFYSFF